MTNEPEEASAVVWKRVDVELSNNARSLASGALICFLFDSQSDDANLHIESNCSCTYAWA